MTLLINRSINNWSRIGFTAGHQTLALKLHELKNRVGNRGPSSSFVGTKLDSVFNLFLV
jgi:hypothetical protein